MRTAIIATTLGLQFLLQPLAYAQPGEPPDDRVKVEFDRTQRYTDIDDDGVDADRNLATLERHLKSEGQRCLAADDTLFLRVLDVDLAGRDEWLTRSGTWIRVMRDTDWPRIKLHYVLRGADGDVVREAVADISDMNYLWRQAYVRSDTRPLAYEYAMLKEWFGKEFCRTTQ